MTKITLNRAQEAQARQTRLLALEENRASREWNRLLRSYAPKYAEAFRIQGQHGLLIVLDDFSREVRETLIAEWRIAMESFAGQTSRALALSQKMRVMARLETKARKDSYVDAAVREWTAKYSAEKVSSITRTQQNKLKDIIAGAVKSGATSAQTAALIQRGMKAASPYDALRIAKTETHAAAMAGADAGAKATGLELVKQWLAAGDDRTRPEHAAADGQTVSMDGAFLVGGERLQFPGDPAGSASNVIQCRCTALHIPAEDLK